MSLEIESLKLIPHSTTGESMYLDEGHAGSTSVTYYGCVHGALRRIMGEIGKKPYQFPIEQGGFPFMQLGFHENYDLSSNSPITFKEELLRSDPCYVNPKLLARRIAEYIWSIQDPSHASNLGQIESLPMNSLKNDFYFGTFYAGIQTVQTSIKSLSAGEKQDYLREAVTLGLYRIEDGKPVFIDGALAGALQQLKPEIDQRRQLYIEYLKTLQSPINWPDVLQLIKPFSASMEPPLSILRKCVEEIETNLMIRNLYSEVPSWTA